MPKTVFASRRRENRHRLAIDVLCVVLTIVFSAGLSFALSYQSTALPLLVNGAQPHVLSWGPDHGPLYGEIDISISRSYWAFSWTILLSYVFFLRMWAMNRKTLSTISIVIVSSATFFLFWWIGLSGFLRVWHTWVGGVGAAGGTMPPSAMLMAEMLGWTPGTPLRAEWTHARELAIMSIVRALTWPAIGFLFAGMVQMSRAYLSVRKSDNKSRQSEEGIHKVVDFDKDALFLSWDAQEEVCVYTGGAAAEFGIKPSSQIGRNVRSIFASAGEEALAAYLKIYNAEVVASAYETEFVNPLNGKTDVWRGELYINDVEHAGYGVIRRITPEREREAEQSRRNSELTEMRNAANERMLKLASVAEERFYGYYANSNNTPDSNLDSVRDGDVAASAS